MPEISQVEVNGTTYDIQDTAARDNCEDIRSNYVETSTMSDYLGKIEAENTYLEKAGGTMFGPLRSKSSKINMRLDPEDETQYDCYRYHWDVNNWNLGTLRSSRVVSDNATANNSVAFDFTSEYPYEDPTSSSGYSTVKNSLRLLVKPGEINSQGKPTAVCSYAVTSPSAFRQAIGVTNTQEFRDAIGVTNSKNFRDSIGLGTLSTLNYGTNTTMFLSNDGTWTNPTKRTVVTADYKVTTLDTNYFYNFFNNNDNLPFIAYQIGSYILAFSGYIRTKASLTADTTYTCYKITSADNSAISGYSLGFGSIGMANGIVNLQANGTITYKPLVNIPANSEIAFKGILI